MAVCESMRQLLLLRHAKSSWDDKRLDDRDRPLAERGRRAAASMGAAMRELGLAPDLVLVSDAKRTMQTLELLEPWEDTPLIEPMPSLYLASAPEMIAMLRGVPETVRSVLLIGHNPGLHELAVTLAGTQGGEANRPALKRLTESYPTATLTEFTIAGPWWTLDAGAGRLVRYLAPGDLPALAP